MFKHCNREDWYKEVKTNNKQAHLSSAGQLTDNSQLVVVILSKIVYTTVVLVTNWSLQIITYW